MNGAKLSVPSFSQSNAIHDQYVGKQGGEYFVVDEAELDGVQVHAGSEESNVWYGRASASMIYNQLVNACIRGAFELPCHDDNLRSHSVIRAETCSMKSRTASDVTGVNRLRIFPIVVLTLLTAMAGCSNAPSDGSTKQSEQASNRSYSVTEMNKEKTQPRSTDARRATPDTLHLPQDTTDCDSAERGEGEMNQYLEKETGRLKVAIATRDSVGIVLQNLFSPPGEWSLITSEDGEGVLRYRCDTDLHEYPNCGQPESIGNPDDYSGSVDITAYFAYRMKPCSDKIFAHFDKLHLNNSKYASEYVSHHGFPSADTVVVNMSKIKI